MCLQKEETAFASVQKALKVLDGYLLEHTFLVGEAVTLADIIAACNLYLGMTKVFMHKHMCWDHMSMLTYVHGSRHATNPAWEHGPDPPTCVNVPTMQMALAQIAKLGYHMPLCCKSCISRNQFDVV